MSKLDKGDLDLIEEALCTGWEIAMAFKGQYRTANGYRESGDAVQRIQEGILAYRRVAGLPPTKKVRRET